MRPFVPKAIALGQISNPSVTIGSQVMLRTCLAIIVALVISLFCLSRMAEMDWAGIIDEVGQKSTGAWILGGVLTTASFICLGLMDRLVHQQSNRNISSFRSVSSGMAAFALSQFIGLGPLVGAIVRYKTLPEIGVVGAVTHTLLMSGLFILGVGLGILGLAYLAGYLGPILATFLGSLIIVGLIANWALPLWGPRWANVPKLSVTMGLFACVFGDLIFSCLTLYVFCDGLTSTDLVVFSFAFVLATGAGLLSGSPSGVGAFDLTFLAFIPLFDQEKVMAAIVVWRAVYFLIPAAIAGLYILLPLAVAAPSDALPRRQLSKAASAGLPYGDLVLQNDHDVHSVKGGKWMIGQSGAHQIGLFDPLSLAPKECMTVLVGRRRLFGRVIAYRVGSAFAQAASNLGWKSILIAKEAMIAPQDYVLDGSAKSGLRRKLRRATGAGATVAEVSLAASSDFAVLADVSGEWERNHGGACGFVMGRFDRRFMAFQRVYAAFVDGQIVAFCSFHTAGAVWTLDLMRHRGVIPEGTMHLIIAEAIAEAKREGVTLLSLATAPRTGFLEASSKTSRWIQRLGLPNFRGLVQFKDSFDPVWQERYAVAPSWLDLIGGLFAVRRAIATARAERYQLHEDHEELRIATFASAWQEQDRPQAKVPQNEEPVVRAA